jgi:hypothetical protein
LIDFFFQSCSPGKHFVYGYKYCNFIYKILKMERDTEGLFVLGQRLDRNRNEVFQSDALVSGIFRRMLAELTELVPDPLPLPRSLESHLASGEQSMMAAAMEDRCICRLVQLRDEFDDILEVDEIDQTLAAAYVSLVRNHFASRVLAAMDEDAIPWPEVVERSKKFFKRFEEARKLTGEECTRAGELFGHHHCGVAILIFFFLFANNSEIFSGRRSSFRSAKGNC